MSYLSIVGVLLTGAPATKQSNSVAVDGDVRKIQIFLDDAFFKLSKNTLFCRPRPQHCIALLWCRCSCLFLQTGITPTRDAPRPIPDRISGQY